MNPMIFCMVPYLSFYDGTEEEQLPEGMNFLPIALSDDGVSRELLFGALHGKSQLPIEKITSDEDLSSGFVSGVTVVFCAKAENGSLVTVGWYKNANVTHTPEILPCENEDGSPCDHPFFFCARAEEAVLLPEDTRFETKWAIPRNKSKAAGKYGFSADSLWLADEPAAKLWKENFAGQIASYDGDNWLDEDDTAETDDGPDSED